MAMLNNQRVYWFMAFIVLDFTLAVMMEVASKIMKTKKRGDKPQTSNILQLCDPWRLPCLQWGYPLVI